MKIVTGQDTPVLRAKAKKIPKVTKEIVELAKRMLETMIQAEGVGLAAPQVGESIRLCLVPIGGKMRALVNPEILKTSGELVKSEEGCLSLPGIWLQIPRYPEVTVRFTDLQGETTERVLKDFEARVVQHEIDHLNGKLIVDF